MLVVVVVLIVVVLVEVEEEVDVVVDVVIEVLLSKVEFISLIFACSLKRFLIRLISSKICVLFNLLDDK